MRTGLEIALLIDESRPLMTNDRSITIYTLKQTRNLLAYMSMFLPFNKKMSESLDRLDAMIERMEQRE